MPFLSSPSVFVKFDKIRPFLLFWSAGSERNGFPSFAQRRSPKRFFLIEKGTLVSAAATNAGT
jgi:hypothetical protein